MKEIKWTLIVTAICAIWHIASAFTLNGTGRYFLGMPAWFSVSLLGSILISAIGLALLFKYVFVDFEYDEECDDKHNSGKGE